MGERVETLETQAKEATTHQRSDLEHELESIQQDLKTLERKYENLEKQSIEAWTDIRVRFDQAIKELHRSTEEISERIYNKESNQ